MAGFGGIESLEQRRLLSADIVADFVGFHPTESIILNGITYFGADDGVHGRELWRTDGTEQGTLMVKDLVPGAEGSGVQGFDIVNGRFLFFTKIGQELALWTTEGTKASTVRLASFGPTEIGGPFTALLGSPGQQRLCMIIQDVNQTSTAELWSTDGTAEGTSRVRSFASDIEPQFASTDNFAFGHYRLTHVNGRMLFVADYHLWASDGTPERTMDLTAKIPALANAPPHDMIAAGDFAYFGRGFGDEELWTTDGTVQGTKLLKVLGSGSAGYTFTLVAGRLFLVQTEAGEIRKLWTSDGTAGGTSVIYQSDFWTPLHSVSPFGDKVIFSTDDGVHGAELWASDGTQSGTHMIKDVTPGATGSFLGSFITIDGIAYFGNYVDYNETHDHGRHQLWRSDGTEEGTYLVKDFGIQNSSLFMQELNGKLYIEIGNADEGRRVETQLLDPATMTVPQGPAQGTTRLVNNVLRILGTPGDDSIRIYQVQEDPTRFVVNINGVKRSYAMEAVKRIDIYGYAGNDNIAVSERFGRVIIRSRIWGDEGHDIINTGSVRDTLFGDNGNDTLISGSADDSLTGGAGNDSLVAGRGNDSASGQQGADTVLGGAGTDMISGGNDEADDQLDGGAGADVIFGHAVHEIFFAGEQGEDPTGLDSVLLN